MLSSASTLARGAVTFRSTAARHASTASVPRAIVGTTTPAKAVAFPRRQLPSFLALPPRHPSLRLPRRSPPPALLLLPTFAHSPPTPSTDMAQASLLVELTYPLLAAMTFTAIGAITPLSCILTRTAATAPHIPLHAAAMLAPMPARSSTTSAQMSIRRVARMGPAAGGSVTRRSSACSASASSPKTGALEITLLPTRPRSARPNILTAWPLTRMSTPSSSARLGAIKSVFLWVKSLTRHGVYQTGNKGIRIWDKGFIAPSIMTIG